MPRRVGVHTRLVCVIAATLTAASLVHAQQPTLDVVLDRLGAYLADYETKVVELVADERYEQWIKRKSGYGGAVVSRRKLQSTFFLMRLADGQAWIGLRDVFSVDGKAVAGGSRAMEDILKEGTADAFEEALRVARENAKYNIGPVYRTINLPLHALELLHPRNRNRIQFAAAGQSRMAGRSSWQIDFDEHARPTIVSDGFGGDRPVQGRVWVDPSTGAVLKTDLRIGGDPSIINEAAISVEYRSNDRLQVFLPAEMEESYTLKIEVLHGRASYRNYRRFQTSARLVTLPN